MMSFAYDQMSLAAFSVTVSCACGSIDGYGTEQATAAKFMARLCLGALAALWLISLLMPHGGAQ